MEEIQVARKENSQKEQPQEQPQRGGRNVKDLISLLLPDQSNWSISGLTAQPSLVPGFSALRPRPRATTPGLLLQPLASATRNGESLGVCKMGLLTALPLHG